MTIEESLRDLIGRANVLPLAYRPDQYDDWGTIRGGGIFFPPDALHYIATVRDSRIDHDVYPAHRKAKTDPYEDVTRLFVDGLNALPALLDALATKQALIDELVEGLEPFARMADLIEPLGMDDAEWATEEESVTLQVGRYRRARALILKAREGQSHG